MTSDDPIIAHKRTPAWWAALERDRRRTAWDRDRCQDCGLVEACDCRGQWPDATPADPAEAASGELGPRIGLLRIGSRSEGVWVCGERTECEYLWITPRVVGGHLTGWWLLTHEPTGRGVPRTEGLDVRELRDVARLVADLDWSSTDPTFFGQAARPYVARLREAVDRAQGLPGRMSVNGATP